MARQRVSETVFIALNYNITTVGNVWLVLMILLRVLVLLFAGYPLYQDEQERFVCNTIQPGCANVCYDIFAPLSLFRFWLLQLASVFLPYALFVIFVIHKVTSSLPVPAETSDRMKAGSVQKTHREPYGEACLVKPIMKSEGRRLPRFTRAYTLQLLFRILLEGGFSAAHYYLFGLRVPSRFMCQQMPCTSTVDCYPSRASEKTVMLGFMLGASGICFLLSVLDLACAITRLLRQERKRKMRVKKMYEEARYFASNPDGAAPCGPLPGSFRKRAGKQPLPSCEGTPLGAGLDLPVCDADGGGGFQVVQDEGVECEGSEVPLCPPEPLPTPRTIRVSKLGRLKPLPPPRRDRAPGTGTMDLSGAVYTRRVGQYSLVEMGSRSEAASSAGDGLEKRSEWV
ncbi:gap junction delta-4 protein [Electrophorus electricus]|uniref:gap junction delta-4 protein n=1 Tax=Electrophorus electricus TaxID=8005 RepID=UPI0015D04043|nr:gap junction delta-4 protein [Electrophorus electricus]